MRVDFRDELGHFLFGTTPGDTWLEQLAAAVPPGARGLTARLAPADAWTWAHWQPPFPSRPTAWAGEQARAIQEAAAYSTRLTAGLISEMLGLGAWPEVVLTGGAARSTLGPQILADVLGGPVSVPDHVESAVLGAAVLAGRGAGQQAYDLLYERWAARRRGTSPRDCDRTVEQLGRRTAAQRLLAGEMAGQLVISRESKPAVSRRR